RNIVFYEKLETRRTFSSFLREKLLVFCEESSKSAIKAHLTKPTAYEISGTNVTS
ncbi:hypothetical protein X975_12868, partial [Stegodyphus mimosarum]